MGHNHLVALLFLLAGLPEVETREHQQTLLHRAEAAYGAGQFGEAEALYGSLIKGAPTAAWLAFNGGTAALAAEDLGPAILHLRRAALLSPRSRAVAHNLRVARERRQDVLDVPAQGLLTQPFGPLLRSFTFCERSFLIGMLSAGAMALGQFFARHYARRGKGVAACLMLLCVAAGINHYGLHRYDTRTHVVCAPETVVRASTHPDSLVRFHLHPGAEVLVVDEHAEWARVRLDTAREGWTPARGLCPVAVDSSDPSCLEKAILPRA